MIENRRSEELKLFYRCFSREESNLVPIIHCLNKHIEAFGNNIIKTPVTSLVILGKRLYS